MASKVTYTIQELDAGFLVTGTVTTDGSVTTTTSTMGACANLNTASTFITEAETTRQNALAMAAATPVGQA